MPLLSSFLGVLVYMFKEKNGPRKQQKYVEAWVALREDEINAAWLALNENGEVIKIKGLEG